MSKCNICEHGNGPKKHLEEIIFALEWLDDKPHQLFNAIYNAAHLVNVNDEQELLKMTHFGLENAHKMFMFAVKVDCDPCEGCNWKGEMLREVS